MSLPDEDLPRFERALRRIDAVHAEDPTRIEWQGRPVPREQLHAERASDWIQRLDPEAGELLRLAARAHHLRRWQLPRSDYPEGRAGYHAWRRELQRCHAAEAGSLLEACGFEPKEIERVQALIQKRGLVRYPEVQRLEDVLCLVFVETQLEEFASRHPEEKIVEILRKSLRKMSPEGRAAAASIELPPSTGALLAKAVAALDPDR
jgi:hypothetical protein